MILVYRRCRFELDANEAKRQKLSLDRSKGFEDQRMRKAKRNDKVITICVHSWKMNSRIVYYFHRANSKGSAYILLQRRGRRAERRSYVRHWRRNGRSFVVDYLLERMARFMSSQRADIHNPLARRAPRATATGLQNFRSLALKYL